MIVYLVTNKTNGKMYVGQHAGTNLKAYWDRNVCLAENGYQGKRLLYRAIRKYGSDGFEVIPLVIVETKQEMDHYEIEIIKFLDTTDPEKGYNITAGGGGSLGVKMGEETRAKMSKAREGKTMTEENRLKFIERNKGNKYSLGKKMTKENFYKLMAVHVGSKRSEEAKKKMSEAHKGVPWSEKQKEARHLAVHVKRNVVNLECKFCQGIQCQSTTEYEPQII
jgi:group I intron endonuclease